MRCIVCNGSDFEIIHKGTRDREDIDVLKCKGCGMVRLSQFLHMNDGYYEESKMRSEKSIDAMAVDERITNSLRREAVFIKDYIGKDICDFGCGKGGFLKLQQYMQIERVE